MSSVVPEIAVLLAHGLGLGVDCRHLLVSGTPDTAENEVACGQCQQPADNASLIPAKIIERTEHFPIHASCLADSDRKGQGQGWRRHSAAGFVLAQGPDRITCCITTSFTALSLTRNCIEAGALNAGRVCGECILLQA